MSDRILGGCGFFLAAFFIWQALQIQESFISDPVGPKAFPIIIAVVFGIASIVIMLRPDPAPVWPAAMQLFEVAVALGVLVAYALLLPQAGFVIATAVAAAFLSWRLGALPLHALAAGIGISGGIYIIFHLLLGLSLASGPLGF